MDGKIPLCCCWLVCPRNPSLAVSCSCIWGLQELWAPPEPRIAQIYPTYLSEGTCENPPDIRGLQLGEVAIGRGSMELASLCFDMGLDFCSFPFLPLWIAETFLPFLFRIKSGLFSFDSLLDQLSQRQRQLLLHITQNSPMSVYLSFLKVQLWSGIAYQGGLVSWHLKFGSIPWSLLESLAYVCIVQY